ncbi:2-hydroxyacid dehydrogenase [Aquimarina algiphila]|uniref:2-hydroxyacid dehydrogenase n=1 Tax=Aquimarina algiphila TaxID=2047982 RepID=UPI0024929192|nr:2-hydroxyacid dehydrogenase [Aquimarina algiphila]
MKILHLDTNHPLLLNQLAAAGFENDEDYTSTKTEIEDNISLYEGIIIRSRFAIDKTFLNKAENLKFIGRVGAGLENIDIQYAQERGIKLFNAPEGNRNAVGEHALGMILSLFNKMNIADQSVRNGQWLREKHRGIELDGKTIGIIGYGNMGRAFAKKLRGFNVEVICYDILDDVEDSNAMQVELQELFEKTDVLSLHTPETPKTIGMINKTFINKFKKPFWLINTARGKSVVTEDLVKSIEEGKVLGAGLDVLEYEKSSFENLFTSKKEVTSSTSSSLSKGSVEMPDAFSALLKMDNIILSPHVAGWTVESKEKLAQTIVDKIKTEFC